MNDMSSNYSPVVRPIFWFCLIFAAMLCIISFCACNPQKALTRKENKAIGIVKGSERAFPIVGQSWLDIHPCLVPTIHDTIINTKTDTVKTIKTVLIPSISYKNKTLDTIVDNISIYADSTGITVKNLNEAITKTITKEVTKVDQTALNAANIKIQSLQQDTSGYKATINEVRSQLADSNKKADTRLMWMWLEGGIFLIILVVSHIVRSYFKF